MEIQPKALPLKQKDVNNNLTIILKVIAITSFFFICGIDQVGLPILISIPLIIIGLFQGLSHFNLETFFGSIFVVGQIGTIILFFRNKRYYDKYLLLFCFISLLLSAFYITGIFNPSNYYDKKAFPISFILPMSIFIISSLILIIKSFKKKNCE